MAGRAVQGPECLKKKAIGEPYEEKPHVRSIRYEDNTSIAD